MANPFDSTDGKLPLLPGSYVEVVFDGLMANQVMRIPRAALHDGERVWINSEGKLEPRAVTITGGDDDTILVSDGLSNGDQLIVSALSLPIEGLPVIVIGGAK